MYVYFIFLANYDLNRAALGAILFSGVGDECSSPYIQVQKRFCAESWAENKMCATTRNNAGRVSLLNRIRLSGALRLFRVIAEKLLTFPSPVRTRVKFVRFRETTSVENDRTKCPSRSAQKRFRREHRLGRYSGETGDGDFSNV